MYTRSQYLNGECTHRQFYLSVAETAGLTLILGDTLRDKLYHAWLQDEHFNTMPLRWWDGFALPDRGRISAALKKHGDCLSLAGCVSLYKTLAKVGLEKYHQTVS